ncbi:MAG: M28 family peptidase [Candidatus Thorarchaeota archaeon]|jgi:hypothetical protein
MERRKLLASLAIIVVVSSAAFGILYLMQPITDQDGNGGDQEVQLHPYNSLNWWNVAWELADPGDFQAVIPQLAAFASRYIDTPGALQTFDYIVAHLEGIGLEGEDWGPSDSVVALHEGYGTDNRAIVFGAHMDSPLAGFGVNQNAAGVGVLLMIAEVLVKFRLPIDIYFCFFGGSLKIFDPIERSLLLLGSTEVSEIFDDEGVDIIAFYNFDELLFYDTDQAEERRIAIEHKSGAASDYHSTKYLADVLISFLKEAGSNIATAVEREDTEHDHQPFWDHGFPAVNVIGGHEYIISELGQDAITNPLYNLTQAVLVGRAALATAIYLGYKGNGELTNYKLEKYLVSGTSSLVQKPMTVTQTISIHGNLNGATSIRMNVTNGLNAPFSVVINPGNFTHEYEATEIGPLTIRLTNDGAYNVTVSLLAEYDSDTDGNGVLDSVQYSWPEPDPPLDWDFDGLSDETEVTLGTDVFSRDTDHDGINDDVEVVNGMDPLRNDLEEDLDNDDVQNSAEIYHGTSPINPDTDFDNMTDGWEITFHTNPLIDDSGQDPDGDNLTNFEEFTYLSDPFSIDGDHDGLLDTEEIELGTNPLHVDSDGDGLRDYLEVLEGLDPLVQDYDYDLSKDGPDHNPKINQILIIGLLIATPVIIGLLLFKRRMK